MMLTEMIIVILINQINNSKSDNYNNNENENNNNNENGNDNKNYKNENLKKKNWIKRTKISRYMVRLIYT